MAKKKKFVTPAGIAVFPRLNRPDTKYNEYGTYSADLRIPVEEAKPLLKELGAVYKGHVGSVHPKFPRARTGTRSGTSSRMRTVIS